MTGVRALNTRPDLLAAREELLAYMEQGGTLVVQYNTVSRRGGGADGAALAPYPMTPSRNRVSREEAAVTFPNPDHPLLNAPNRITQRDFEGWVQERGLYFMSGWDERYDAILQCNDPGEPPRLGGLLYAPLRPGRLHLHGLLVVSSTAGGGSRGVSDLRQSAERRKSTTNATHPVTFLEWSGLQRMLGFWESCDRGLRCVFVARTPTSAAATLMSTLASGRPLGIPELW